MALGLPQESMAMKQEHLMGISPTKYRLGQLNMLRLGKLHVLDPEISQLGLPSGKRLHFANWKIIMFNG